MKKKSIWRGSILPLILSVALCSGLFTGCGSAASDSDAETEAEEEATEAEEEETEEETTASSTDPVTMTAFAMDTYMTVTVYGNEAEEAAEAALAEIERLDALLSTGDEDSEVYSINANGGGTLSEDTEYLLQRSLELWESTGGCFEITIYPVMDAWGFTDDDFQVPTGETLETLLTLVDSSKIVYDEENSMITLEEGMAIDFGGIAKGYTSSQIMEIFGEYDITGGLVSLGGNIQVTGDKPTATTWKVAVQNPDEDGDYLCILEVDDVAVITSGGYERYFEEDGVTYHHIIDPTTGYPANNGLTSVTIVCDDGTKADGLSTSLFIMGTETAIEYWRAHSDEFDVVLLDEEGTIYISEGLADCYTSDYEVEILYAE